MLLPRPADALAAVTATRFARATNSPLQVEGISEHEVAMGHVGGPPDVEDSLDSPAGGRFGPGSWPGVSSGKHDALDSTQDFASGHVKRPVE